MPVYKCPNGKYRIGSGKCIYDTKEKATEVWQAIIAEGNYSANINKVSFDFDGTISTKRGQDMATKFMNEGKIVYIITRRNETMSGQVYKVAEKLNISKNKIFFTNGKYKWEAIKRLDIGAHYDNNQQEIDLINANTDAKGIKF